jgi:3'(2'), 5'-bisphosphate nucleotidase
VADTIAEAIIIEGLRETGIPVVAEEMMAAGAVMQPSARYWLVDPLDGTKEFAKGIDEFVVCIGLIEDGFPRLGVIALPVEGSVVGGLVTEGVAWKRHDGIHRPISARRRPQAGLTVLDSRSHPNPARVERILAGHALAETRHMGSAMKFAVLAEGLADVIPRPGTTMEWDSAAGQAVVEAAGGRVTDMAGARLAYGKPDFKNAGFIAWGAD